MVARIMLGEINTVFVKDFSRFSREHILMSEFLEKIFPKRKIRFVSVTDNFDSINSTASLSISFKSLFNEYYCKDISNKVKSTLSAKKEAGSYSTANVPFGYCKKNAVEIEINSDEAVIIQKIFLLAYNGHNCREIADILNEQNCFVGRKCQLWDASYVWSVISNPFYTGMHIWHKYEMNPYQAGKVLRLPRNCWKTSNGNHEGIVSKELFNIVNSCHNPSKSVPKGKRHIFHGITKCKNCHKALCLGRRKKEYLCCNHCGSGEIKKIHIDILYRICLEKINEEYKQYIDILDQKTFFTNFSSNKENSLFFKELLLQNFIKKVEIGDNDNIDIFWHFGRYNNI